MENSWIYLSHIYLHFLSKAWGECWRACMWPWLYLYGHQCTTKMMERLTEWCMSPSLRRWTLYPQQSLTIVVPRWIHTLMMASNVLAERSGRGSRQVSPIPARYQHRPMLSRANRCNYTSPDEAALIYFHNFATPHLPTNIRRAVKKQLKIKFDIALWQKCDQSRTVWWSTQSSAWHWRVGEWCLTLNKIGDDRKETT